MNEVRSLGLHNIYGYEVWNEPENNSWHGKYVASMESSNSYVDFFVNVPTAKTYTMTIGYANGSGSNATQNLCYNGLPCSTVTYPPTEGWGIFNTVNVNVNLTTGDNIIRLASL
ncbi:carbohydrate-binding protein [Paenibacillus mellifer]|uniref:carbohydrate-binding protein n=1 Tax=Paenibacillus mellifer TaxID=2937794 RepID=UPI003555F78A